MRDDPSQRRGVLLGDEERAPARAAARKRQSARAAVVLAACLAGVAGAWGEGGDDVETCLACHGDAELAREFSDGSKASLYFDVDGFRKSVHGSSVACTDCHSGYAEIPHPERSFASAEAFRTSFRDLCKRCHFETHTESLDGVHWQLLAEGDARAPFCTDCHGAHDVVPPNRPRTRVSDTCSTCHAEVAETYLKSVHGKALLAGHVDDVPVCTDCHRSHDIADPRKESWLIRTPELCGRCHTDEERMKRYGISTNVLQTYLADFHGMSASLSRARSSDKVGEPRVTALCIDCHGVHDIARTDDPGSPVLETNLVRTCRKCHADASENFPRAWLSHYEPSWRKAPLVYGVKVFYGAFIPFVIGGLCLQILLHLWRVVVNR